MTNKTPGKSHARVFLQKHISILLAVLVFVFGMMTRNGFAAGATRHKVTDIDGIVTVMELSGLDLQYYAKYNKDIQAVKKDLIPASAISKHVLWNSKPKRILAKAIPGTTIIVSPVETNFAINKYQSPGYYISRKNFTITSSSISPINKDDGMWFFLPINPPMNGKAAERFRLPYTKDVDMICAQWRSAHMYLQTSSEAAKKYASLKNFVRTEYYIFTSDEAFKKAYKIWTGKTITGLIGSSSITKKESAKITTNQNKNNSKSTVQPKQSEDDSDGLGTIGMVGVGLAAAGAIGFGASRFLGGGGGGSGAGTAEPLPQEPESFVYTDPATGAQTLYEKDPNTGEWFDPSTGAITDSGKLEEYTRQRMQDRAWMNGQMENMNNRTTQTDRILQSDQDRLKKQFEEIDRQGAKDKAAIRSGTYGMSDAQRTEYLNKRQETYVSKQDAAQRTAKNWDRAVKAAEVTQKAADLAVDGLSIATGPAGKMVANVYTGVKNVAGETAEAVTKGESIVGGITKGVVKGGADILQNLAGDSEMKWFQKAGSYLATEVGKELVVATIDGESKAAALGKGVYNAGLKFTVDVIGDNISQGFAQQNSNAMKQHYKEISWNWNKTLSPKSVNALNKMNFQKFAGKEQARELAQGFAQSFTKDMGSTAYDMASEGKSATEAMFGEKW